jgi:hypothetical protein
LESTFLSSNSVCDGSGTVFAPVFVVWRHCRNPARGTFIYLFEYQYS